MSTKRVAVLAILIRNGKALLDEWEEVNYRLSGGDDEG